MEIRTYKTSPEKLELVLERILHRGESTGSWYCVDRLGVKGLESQSGCMSRVRIEIEDSEQPHAA